MQAKIARFIDQNQLLVQNKPVLLGLSGGADSLALLHMLYSLKYTVVCAHFNHQLRDDSNADAEKAKIYVESLGLRFLLGSADVKAYQQANRLSLEEAARTLRYQFLFDKARECNAQAVVTGHNADDQAETVLMHLLRGAGLDGLKGMPPGVILPAWDEEIPLVRPLIEISRTEIEAYLASQNLVAVEDASNRDTTLFRNRLRHELLPFLEEYNPQIRTQLAKMARTLQGDESLLDDLAKKGLLDALEQANPDSLGFQRAVLRSQPHALQARVLRKAVYRLQPGMRDFDYAAVQRALELVNSEKPSGVVDLVGGLKLFVENERVWLAESEAALPTQGWPQVIAAVTLVEGETHLPGGWVLSMQQVAIIPEDAYLNRDPFKVYLDPNKLSAPLELRARLPGDKVHPLGMDGRSVKLADFMINQKIAKRARKNWPLVVCGGKIAWVAGFAPCEPFALSGSSTGTLVLSLRFEGRLGV